MGAQGSTTIDFGAFPGKSDASVVITGQSGIVAGSLVEAWIRPVDTDEHSADEHMVETLKIFAGSIVAGVGFTIYGFNTSEITEPLEDAGVGRNHKGDGTAAANIGFGSNTLTGSAGGKGTRIYGQWAVAWVWN